MTTVTADREVTALLPASRAALAPVTARRIARALAIYAAVWLLGLLLVVIDAGVRWEATGLGLAVPGGGFLYGGHTVLAVLAVFAFTLGVFAWWAFGIVLAPPLVWLATADREALRRGFEEEFLRPDGKVIGVRTKLLGLSWNLWAGAMVQVNTVYWLHASLPEIAHRTRWLLRQKELRLTGGRAALPVVISSRLDPGNYTLGRDTFAQCAVLMAARELGDEEYAQAAQRALDAKEPESANGALRHRGASVWTNSYAALGRFGRYSGLRDLLAFGVPPEWRTGPVLAEAGYPEVLVAKAVTDGHALDLVLRPGAGPTRTSLALERLTPDRTYTVTGGCAERVTADERGRAMVEVELADRTEVRIF